MSRYTVESVFVRPSGFSVPEAASSCLGPNDRFEEAAPLAPCAVWTGVQRPPIFSSKLPAPAENGVLRQTGPLLHEHQCTCRGNRPRRSLLHALQNPIHDVSLSAQFLLRRTLRRSILAMLRASV